MPLLELHRYVWFFADGTFRQGVLLAGLLERSRALFDGPIQSIPLPNEIPAEVPRITLQNQANTLILRSSVDRVTLERFYDGEMPRDQIAADLRFVGELFPVARGAMAARTSRVAYNRDRTFRDPEAAMHLARYFVRPELTSRERNPPGPLSRCQNFEVHAHKTYAIGPGVMINSWFRCSSAIGRDNQTPVLAIAQDLNTLAEEAPTRNLLDEDAIDLLRAMTEEVQPIFDLYFPQGVPE